MINFPNLLTSFRILLIPVFIILFLVPDSTRSILAAIVFLVAALTDWLDGYLARKWQQVTKLGKLLDPVADKLLVLAALILLVDFQRVESWLVIILIGREIAMTGLRAIASTDGIVIPAEKTGKYKLFLQATAIVLLILDYKVPLNFRLWGNVMLWISMVLALVSMVQYAIHYVSQLQMRSTRG